MSRSYKKTLGYTDQQRRGTVRSKIIKFWKRYSNKKIRKYKHNLKGNLYKKLTNSWIICDCKWLIFSKDDFDFFLTRFKPWKIKNK